jgi:ribosomal protein S18 acetylase RimI-like enzyme
MKSEIRRARRGDSLSLSPLMEAFSEVEGIPWRPELALPGFERLVADRSIGFVLVAEPSGGEPGGYTMVTFSFDLEFGGRDAFVTELFVAPHLRRKGLARSLLAAAEVEAARNDVGALHLLVLPDNDRARALYAKVGYAVSPRIMMTKVVPR